MMAAEAVESLKEEEWLTQTDLELLLKRVEQCFPIAAV